MVTLIDEHFEGGTNAAALTTSNTAFSSIVGVPVFTTDSLSGLAMKVLTTADNRYGNLTFSLTPILYVRFYIKLIGTTVQSYLTNVPSSLASLRVNANGSLRARNGASAVGSDTTSVLTNTSFTRVEYKMDWTAGQQQLQMFTGANLHGATPNYDSGNLALTTGSGVTSIGVGALLGAVTGASYIIDDVKIATTGWIGASVAPPSNTVPTAVLTQGGMKLSKFRTAVGGQLNGANVSVTIPPDAQPGDVALAWCTIGLVSTSMMAPAGWVQEGIIESTTSQSTALWSKVLTAADINKPLSFSGGSGKQGVVVVVYSDVDPTDPVGDAQVTVASGSSATRTSPSMTAVGRLIEAAFSKGTDPGLWTPPAGFTSRVSLAQAGSGSVTMAVAGSESDLAGPNTWTLAAAMAQGTVWGVWLNPVYSGGGSAEPWSVVTLDGTGSNDPDGTIVSYAWAQTAGPTVTLVGSGATRTFEAPGTIAGTTLTFTLTVTDEDGGVSSPASVSVTVLPVTERMAVGGVLVPMKIRPAKLAP